MSRGRVCLVSRDAGSELAAERLECHCVLRVLHDVPVGSPAVLAVIDVRLGVAVPDAERLQVGHRSATIAIRRYRLWRMRSNRWRWPLRLGSRRWRRWRRLLPPTNGRRSARWLRCLGARRPLLVRLSLRLRGTLHGLVSSVRPLCGQAATDAGWCKVRAPAAGTSPAAVAHGRERQLRDVGARLRTGPPCGAIADAIAPAIPGVLGDRDLEPLPVALPFGRADPGRSDANGAAPSLPHTRPPGYTCRTMVGVAPPPRYP